MKTTEKNIIAFLDDTNSLIIGEGTYECDSLNVRDPMRLEYSSKKDKNNPQIQLISIMPRIFTSDVYTPVEIIYKNSQIKKIVMGELNIEIINKYKGMCTPVSTIVEEDINTSKTDNDKFSIFKGLYTTILNPPLENDENGMDAKMTHLNEGRFKHLCECACIIDEKNIPGDIVECGVWRGGSTIFLSALLSERKIYACDSFNGFQNIDDVSYSYKGETHLETFGKPDGIKGWDVISSVDLVKNNFKKCSISHENVIFVPGFVNKTLPTLPTNEIALLHIDLDAYSAQIDALEYCYNKITTGGLILFDDPGLPETKDALKYFNETFQPDIPMVHVSNTGGSTLYAKGGLN